MKYTVDLMMKHVIDCDANPFIPRHDWSVETHTKGGQLAFDPNKIEFYLLPNQHNGDAINGNQLRKELANKPVLNANVLDYLLAHQYIIPEDWKREDQKKDERGVACYIFFWGTIYRETFGNLGVRFLCWKDECWNWGYDCLNKDDWDLLSPAAVSAN